jgi:hypothetical protein
MTVAEPNTVPVTVVNSSEVEIVGSVTISALPSVTIAALPSVVVLSMPDVDVSSMPTVNINILSDLPAGSQQEVVSSGNVANATASATLSASEGAITYITGFEVTGSGSTLGSVVTVTVTGLIGGTASYAYTFAAGAAAANQPLVVAFAKPIRASSTNTPIVVSCPAGGLGNTHNSVVAHGYSM